ncbi:MAG: hypothetical protein HS111_06365 [Kofleriaceae bacterium]|nr:hypothetical protein [Kofleriaceae bacterium]
MSGGHDARCRHGQEHRLRKDKTSRTALVDDAPRGFVPAVATLAVDTGELAAATALGVTADVRTELAKSALTLLDSGEALVKSGFAVARKLVTRPRRRGRRAPGHGREDRRHLGQRRPHHDPRRRHRVLGRGQRGRRPPRQLTPGADRGPAGGAGA